MRYFVGVAELIVGKMYDARDWMEENKICDFETFLWAFCLGLMTAGIIIGISL